MRGFSHLNSPTHEGKTNTWLTPLNIIKALGEFDLDPCGFEDHETAKKLIILPKDGLTEPWQGRVWLNPPYGKKIGLWLKKLEAHNNGMALVFARTDTNWFQSLNPDALLFLKGRVKFLKPDFSKDSNAGHGSMLLAFGKENVKELMNTKLVGKRYFI